MPKALPRLAVILKDNEKALHILLKELKFSHKEKKELESLVKLAGHLCMDSRELLYEHGLETTRDVLLLQVAQGYNHILLEQLQLSWEKPVFPLSVEDLKTLGIAPGPLFGNMQKPSGSNKFLLLTQPNAWKKPESIPSLSLLTPRNISK
ncbi:unnamed protein product [Blepharisma stoltei]|uniref:Uncharacterized protein n=1 Tax=Blepharisma stoltei TaxID=1481888 RepID=A0AAU9JF23_9CILI|nr:unnamed protein product [Blepharisma stoltei]